MEVRLNTFYDQKARKSDLQVRVVNGAVTLRRAAGGDVGDVSGDVSDEARPRSDVTARDGRVRFGGGGGGGSLDGAPSTPAGHPRRVHVDLVAGRRHAQRHGEHEDAERLERGRQSVRRVPVPI